MFGYIRFGTIVLG